MKRAYRATASNGQEIFVLRPADAGDDLYTTKRYKAREEDVMPKYILNENAAGSVTDVQAQGVWKNGRWTLELSRKLNTGNPDDAVFGAGSVLRGGIAVFDHSGDDDHSHSDVVMFQL